MDFSNNRKKNQAKNIKTQIITFFVKELQIKLKAKKTKVVRKKVAKSETVAPVVTQSEVSTAEAVNTVTSEVSATAE